MQIKTNLIRKKWGERRKGRKIDRGRGGGEGSRDGRRK